MNDERLQRILALHEATMHIADPRHPAGREAREALPAETGLSRQGVEYAICECLEHSVGRAALSGLVKRTPLGKKSHVLLSANVFTAAFRAIVLGLCHSPDTHVRASRRSPTFARLLYEHSRGAFELVDELHPEADESFWVYGTDATIEEVRRKLPSGVRLFAHGAGMGAAVFRERIHFDDPDLPEVVDALARDVIAFDQRGCLSPRVVLVEGGWDFARSVCDLLVRSLSVWEQRVPRGELNASETADALRHEATMTYLGSCMPAGMGLVFLDPVPNRILIPPVGRYLHVSICDDPLTALTRLGRHLTSVAFYNGQELPGRLREAIGDRRYVDPGQMQRPALDGPVDLRQGFDPEIV